ncbi:3-phosphoinositide-dependent protein kinase 1-like isoform X2 [Eriocheir sinensis]|nr:3-phosphoinositide-dependent protein kinase 1-like isoform X2 [Eriocheir sinensis]
MPRSPRAEKAREKRSDRDFIFGKLIGEGSFSSVYLAKDIHTSQEYAVKVCDKEHIRRERKVQQIIREKDVMNILNDRWCVTAPFFVKLSYAFQDVAKLYFVMTYCKNGELLNLIQRVGNFDREGARFYAAEMVRALEHLHSLSIIHRDLKPENILLDEQMHIKITDFGCAKILSAEEVEEATGPEEPARGGGGGGGGRKSSFVGTAQYVSPELLSGKPCGPMADIWALGCILYQMVSGLPPFRSKSEYFIYQKIQKLEYEFPPGFCNDSRDLVTKLLVIEPEQRLGAHDPPGRYTALRSHPLFSDLDLDDMQNRKPPKIAPFLSQGDEEIHWDKNLPGLNSIELQLELGLALRDTVEEEEEEGKNASSPSSSSSSSFSKNMGKKRRNLADVSEEERVLRMVEQKTNKWNKFVEGNLILKQGLMDKRKGLFPRRRMFLLTSGPHLYYIDPVNLVLKGQIPWSSTLATEAKNFKTFFVHTPNRTYYLEEPNGFALEWCKAIEEVKAFYFPTSTTTTTTTTTTGART